MLFVEGCNYVEGSILQYIAKEWPISDANNPTDACD